MVTPSETSYVVVSPDQASVLLQVISCAGDAASRLNLDGIQELVGLSDDEMRVLKKIRESLKDLLREKSDAR